VCIFSVFKTSRTYAFTVSKTEIAIFFTWKAGFLMKAEATACWDLASHGKEFS
jgi:hypothetical protein